MKGAHEKKNEKPMKALHELAGEKTPMSKKKKLIIIFSSIGAVLLALIIAVVSIVTGYLNQVNRVSDLSGDLGINSDLPTKGVQNIALSK